MQMISLIGLLRAVRDDGILDARKNDRVITPSRFILQEEIIMKCPICGAEIQDDALFCTNCGQKLPQQAAAPAEETVTVSGEPYEALLAKVKSFLDDRRSELQKALQDN